MSAQLSSDILESQFGPTTLEVLYQEATERIIATRSSASGQLLEYSWVLFRPEGAEVFPNVHRTVLGGTSMGAAFRSQDVPFQRATHATYAADIPRLFAERFGTAGQATIVTLTVLVGADAVPYADIFEVYSPAVSWPDPNTRIDAAAADRFTAFAARLAALN